MTANIEQLRALAERLEKATGHSDELNLALSLAFDGWEEDVNNVWSEHGSYMGSPNAASPYYAGIHARAYTSSIDAALALVERLLPGWAWTADCVREWDGGQLVSTQFYACIDKYHGRGVETYGAPTAPLAILRALVAALTTQAEAAQ